MSHSLQDPPLPRQHSKLSRRQCSQGHQLLLQKQLARFRSQQQALPQEQHLSLQQATSRSTHSGP